MQDFATREGWLMRWSGESPLHNALHINPRCGIFYLHRQLTLIMPFNNSSEWQRPEWDLNLFVLLQTRNMLTILPQSHTKVKEIILKYISCVDSTYQGTTYLTILLFCFGSTFSRASPSTTKKIHVQMSAIIQPLCVI